MEELLNQILGKIKGLESEAIKAREQQVIFENNITREMKAIQETQLIAMEKWDKCNDIMERVEMLLEDKESNSVAIDAKLIDHETRIAIIEQAG